MLTYAGGEQSLAQQYNLAGNLGMPTRVASELHAVGGHGQHDLDLASWYHPESPLFWVGVIALATFGLAAVSTSGSVRVGPLHASASAGAGK